MSESTQAVPPGRPGNLSEQQSAALDSIKTSLVNDTIYTADALPEDDYLCRFLRARDWNTKKAVAMLTKNKEWRDSFGIDKLFRDWDMPKEEKDGILRAWPQFFHKTDNQGRLLYIQQCNVEPSALFAAAGGEDRLLQNFAVDFESVLRVRYPACTRAAGHLVDDSLILMDMSNVSLAAFWSIRSLLIKIIGWSQDHYPETNGKVRIINAGWSFSTMYAAIKPFIAPRTAEKIIIMGTDYLPALLKDVDAESLPSFLGGKCECPGGCMFSNEGPWKAASEKTPAPDPEKAVEAAAHGTTNETAVEAQT